MPYESFDVGVVIEESPPVSQWAEMTYMPVAILDGAPATAPWTPLGKGVRGRQFFAGVATVEMFTGDAGLLRDNLVGGDPRIWVILRPTGSAPPYDLFMVTVDPTMGESAQDNPGDIAVALPMPPAIAERVAAFVDAHYVERPFVKRKRDQFHEDGSGERDASDKDRRR